MAAALKRKGKGDDVTEDDMDSVILAHNCKRPLQPFLHDQLAIMAVHSKLLSRRPWYPTHTLTPPFCYGLFTNWRGEDPAALDCVLLSLSC